MTAVVLPLWILPVAWFAVVWALVGLLSLKAKFTRKRRPYDWKSEGFVA
jgi:hypothetical protein